MIIASGVAIGLALVVPQIAAVATSTVALKVSGFELPSKEQIARTDTAIARMKANDARRARELLEDDRENPQRLTLADCKAGSTAKPCPAVRMWLGLDRR